MYICQNALLQIVVAPGEEAELNEKVNSVKVILTPTDSNTPMRVDQLEVKVCKGKLWDINYNN